MCVMHNYKGNGQINFFHYQTSFQTVMHDPNVVLGKWQFLLIRENTYKYKDPLFYLKTVIFHVLSERL